jgi:hypothetical protein
MHVRSERLTVARREGFVVFIVGARINKWWMVPVIFGVAMAMQRMLKQLLADPASGLLAVESFSGRTTMSVQYWRSTDDLLRYARAKEQAHASTWSRWIRSWGEGGAVGIYHETYVIAPGAYECVYHHMPPFGLGRLGPVVPAEGELRTAAGRLAAGKGQASAAA